MKEWKQVHVGEHEVRRGRQGGGEMKKGSHVGKEHGVREGVNLVKEEGRAGIG